MDDRGQSIQADRAVSEPTDDGNLRDLFPQLSQELCEPLTALRERFAHFHCDGTSPHSEAEDGQLKEMEAICDDLIRLTENYLGYAAVGAARVRSATRACRSGN